MRRLLVIGIGAGDPDHLTVQAIKAMNRAEVFFVVDKGDGARELTRLRHELCERFVERPGYRIVAVPDPPRDRTAAAYRPAVEDWRQRRAELWARTLHQELGEDGCGAFLVWGDPSLYDSTLDVLERILADGGLEFDYQVVPGISSVQALAAGHRIALNRVGGPVHITTGRRLTDGFPDHSDDVVVMLDAACAFEGLTDQDLDIYWGAYVGTDDELLVSGRLADVAAEIKATRQAARERKGWIMDTYLLRRRRG
ncbi:MAG TPA: precorrin-6A synthase (deacetylating) [Actinomycetes bacterium]|jgi:precorrin-6A synthase|nr:precorrin-6A synthase (deacetylating) [Actinomycetes bacterium]